VNKIVSHAINNIKATSKYYLACRSVDLLERLSNSWSGQCYTMITAVIWEKIFLKLRGKHIS